MHLRVLPILSRVSHNDIYKFDPAYSHAVKHTQA